MLRKIRKVLAGEKGQGMTEYIIVVAIMAVACIVIYNMFGEQIGQKTKDITSTLESEIKTTSD
ncbi:MAG: Flp family type IVb pilin [Desulfobacterales bacterium]|nr:MAG: Flp family type IVb pilin [Desulfobacterales bacterium]